MPNEPPATELPGITVVGRRRREVEDPWPPQPPLKYDPPEGEAEEIPDDSQYGPCDDPATRAEVNADAAGAEALAQARAAAADRNETLADREYGAYLYRNLDGTVDVVRLEPGPGGGYGPPLNHEGLDPNRVVGYFHNDVSGGPDMGFSPGDWEVYRAIYNRGTNLGADMSQLRMYLGGSYASYENETFVLFVAKGGEFGTTETVGVHAGTQPC